MRIPHGMTARQQKVFLKDADKARNEYAAKRDAAKKEYNDLVSRGRIKQPGKYDALINTANGHPDNPSTQAARRTLTKRGIDWRTGKKLRKK